MTPVAHLVTVGAPAPAALDDAAGDAVGAVLAAAGVPVVSRCWIEDDEPALERALGPDDALTVILAGTGGSAGDIVRRTLARIAGARLVLSERMQAALEESWRRQDRPLPRRAERLALLPQGATVWAVAGIEPGWLLESGGRVFAVLPRASAARLAAAHLASFARERLVGRGATALRTLRTAGVEAAELEERLAGWLGQEGEVAVTTLPAEGEVWVRLRARGPTPADAARTLARVEAAVASALGDDCFGRDAESLEAVVGGLLRERGWTLAVAESCTAGLLGHRVTSIPGSSAWFERGVLVYSNRAKQDLLDVPEALLRTHGAVSAPCAEAMARAVAERAGTRCGLAITGIAGPEGGTPDKPVGTVFVAVAVGGEVRSRRYRFAGDRASVKWQATQAALDLLRRALQRKR